MSLLQNRLECVVFSNFHFVIFSFLNSPPPLFINSNTNFPPKIENKLPRDTHEYCMCLHKVFYYANLVRLWSNIVSEFHVTKLEKLLRESCMCYTDGNLSYKFGMCLFTAIISVFLIKQLPYARWSNLVYGMKQLSYCVKLPKKLIFPQFFVEGQKFF